MIVLYLKKQRGLIFLNLPGDFFQWSLKINLQKTTWATKKNLGYLNHEILVV